MDRSKLRAWFPWISMGLVVCACWAVVLWHVSGWRGRHVGRTHPVVCIDPGHPSETNSARRMVNGTTELEMNWEMARNLAEALRKRGIETVLTKTACDEFVPNHVRALVANDCEADLTVHLHCDAGPGRGYTIYFPNRQGTFQGVTGPSQEVIDASRRSAYLLHEGMAGPLRGWLHDRGIKGDSMTKIGQAYGTLTTSAFSQVPTLTIEMCFLTNRRDAEFIKSQGGKRKLTEALTAGVVKYLLANGYREENGKLVPVKPLR